MPRFSKNTRLVFIVATLAGACLHFVHDLLPNPVTALISPVNESLWEHLKILFWPFLASALWLNRGGEKGCRGPWYLAALLASALMLGVGYAYHIGAGGDSLTFDVCLYVLAMGAAFALARLLDRPSVRAKSGLLGLLVLTLAGALVLFTFLPPEGSLFADLSRVGLSAAKSPVIPSI